MQLFAEGAVQHGAGLFFIAEDEREIEDAHLAHHAGQPAAVHHAKFDRAAQHGRDHRHALAQRAAADLVVGLGRGLQVIESFDDQHPRQTVAKASRRTALPRSAARRHLPILCHFGDALTDGKQFWLTPKVLRLGQGHLGAARLPRQVQPFIQRSSMATGETVNVSVLDGSEVVDIARSNSPRLVSIGFHAGARVPAHVVAPGVVLLASLDDAALGAWVAGHWHAGAIAQLAA